MIMTTESVNNEIKRLANSDIMSAKMTIAKEVEALNIMGNNLDESLTEALDLMQAARGRVILTGMGKSGHIAKKIAASLASTGTTSFFVHPAEASHGDLGMITSDDVIIAISNSGESKELVDILNYSKRFGIKLIAITKNPESSLGKAGDVVLKLPLCKEACPLGLAPTSSTTATLVLGDILTVAMIERKGFSKEQFNQRHPGGKLGSILKRVGDLMHTGQDMPILDVKEASSFSTPQERFENDLKVQEFHKKVSTESTAARLQILDEIKDLQKQVEKLLSTDFGNTLSDKQKMAMLQALRAKMKVLDSKLKYVNDTEKEINEKYERKKKLEGSSYAAGNIKYPAVDPFNPTDEDRKRMSTSSKNIGFLSFSNYKRTWEDDSSDNGSEDKL